MQNVKVGDKFKSLEGNTYVITDAGESQEDLLSMNLIGDRWPIILTRDRLELLVKLDGWVPLIAEEEKHKHRFATYLGFTDTFIYCKDCGEKI